MLKKMRIAKFIANAGFCSRREAEKLIEDKIIKINNHLCLHPSETVNDSDKVTIGKKIIQIQNTIRLWKIYKPIKYICTTKDDMDIALLNYRGFTPSKERYNSTINEGTLKHIDSDNIKILLSKLYVQSLSFIVGNIEDETIVQRNIMEHCQKFYPEIVFAYSHIQW